MSLRHSVLGLLALQPATGYELLQKFDNSLSHAWHASHSQIYPELARLSEEGLAEIVGEGPRRSKTYAITSAGREELRRWLMETEPVRTSRNETAVRAFLVPLLPPEQQRPIWERELAYAEANVAELEGYASVVPSTSPFRSNVDLGLQMTRLIRDWVRERLDEVS
jgi:PadR family transcriptional regulator AphA